MKECKCECVCVCVFFAEMISVALNDPENIL